MAAYWMIVFTHGHGHNSWSPCSLLLIWYDVWGFQSCRDERSNRQILLCPWCAWGGRRGHCSQGLRVWERTPLPSAFDDSVEWSLVCSPFMWAGPKLEETEMIYSVMGTSEGCGLLILGLVGMLSVSAWAIFTLEMWSSKRTHQGFLEPLPTLFGYPLFSSVCSEAPERGTVCSPGPQMLLLCWALVLGSPIWDQRCPLGGGLCPSSRHC